MDISIALGGGGAKGNAHIGVLRLLEKEGYHIRAVAGTSFGGIVAAIYAAGYTPAEIEDIFCRVDQRKLYSRGPKGRPSLLGMEGVTQWLTETLGDRLFMDLKIPCAVTAVDLNAGQEVVLSEGLVRDAVLATIALPGIFPSFEMDGLELVDGGVVNPIPVSVARMLAPGLPVVAVTLAQSLGSPTHKWKMPMPTLVPRMVVERVNRMNIAQSLDIYMRAVEVGSRALAEYRLKADHPEVVVRPAVGMIDLLETVDPSLVAKLGEEAMAVALPELRWVVSWQARFSRFLGGGR